MGALFSACLGGDEARDASRPLVERTAASDEAEREAAARAKRLNFTRSPSAAGGLSVGGGGGGGGGALGDAARPPRFKVSKRGASKRAAEAAASRTSSGIFCRCGGPGSLVQLLPCKCFSLCLACAQMEAACPDCGAAVADSVPSWRAAEASP